MFSMGWKEYNANNIQFFLLAPNRFLTFGPQSSVKAFMKSSSTFKLVIDIQKLKVINFIKYVS